MDKEALSSCAPMMFGQCIGTICEQLLIVAHALMQPGRAQAENQSDVQEAAGCWSESPRAKPKSMPVVALVAVSMISGSCTQVHAIPHCSRCIFHEEGIIRRSRCAHLQGHAGRACHLRWQQQQAHTQPTFCQGTWAATWQQPASHRETAALLRLRSSPVCMPARRGLWSWASGQRT